MKPLRIFIGYDDRQTISYTVLQNSIMRRASKPVAITPLVLETLPITRRGLTPFTYSRFLVPYLCGYEGVGLFIDADMLVVDDIAKMFDLSDPECDVQCVQQGMQFEWSSVMLFNNEKCKILTPDYVQNGPSPMPLAWAKKVGQLPFRWNHLVGYSPPSEDVSLIHFTQGIPTWPETAASEHGDKWRAEMLHTMSRQEWETLMGNSVHAIHVRDRLAKSA